eukprot:GGOE01007909.1.p1 GENE.GGOE01007909.1~~GGOE01007909.1.p1  ORF type:complete len:556 (+),score=68.80 GGOE01007909.1:29-1669(+)
MKEDNVRISLISEHRFIKQNKVISVPNNIAFDSLFEKIKECTSLRGNLSILWQDEDDDRIDIAGDEDWTNALLYQRYHNQPKHFVFILKEDSTSPASSTSQSSSVEEKLKSCTSWQEDNGSAAWEGSSSPISKQQLSPPESPQHGVVAAGIHVLRQRSIDLPQIPKLPVNQFQRPRSVSDAVYGRFGGATQQRKPLLPWMPSSHGNRSVRTPECRRQLLERVDLVACLQRNGVPLVNRNAKGLAKVPESTRGFAASKASPSDAAKGMLSSPAAGANSRWQRVDSPSGRRHFVLEKLASPSDPAAAAPTAARQLPTMEPRAADSTAAPPNAANADSELVPIPTCFANKAETCTERTQDGAAGAAAKPQCCLGGSSLSTQTSLEGTTATAQTQAQSSGVVATTRSLVQVGRQCSSPRHVCISPPTPLEVQRASPTEVHEWGQTPASHHKGAPSAPTASPPTTPASLAPSSTANPADVVQLEGQMLLLRQQAEKVAAAMSVASEESTECFPRQALPPSHAQWNTRSLTQAPPGPQVSGCVPLLVNRCCC